MNTNTTADLCARVEGEMWFGDVEAHGGTHIRVRIRPSAWGALPSWASGTLADCTIGLPRKPHYAEARVLKQDGPTVWLGIPATWSVNERRSSSRKLGGFSVRCAVDGTHGQATCLDVSSGGMRVSMEREYPFSTPVTVEFTLPGDSDTIELQGIVLTSTTSNPASPPVEARIKFLSITPSDGLRIARYCSR